MEEETFEPDPAEYRRAERRIAELEAEVERLEAERERLGDSLDEMRRVTQLNAEVLTIVNAMVEELLD